MKETAITRKIRDRLKSLGFHTIKIHGGPMQQAGLPDVLAIRDGRALWLEIKQPGLHATELQLYRLKQMRDHGCTAVVAHDVEEAEAAVTKFESVK